MKIARTKHYARSLVEIGQECGCFDELIADLIDVDEKINLHLDLKTFLLDKQVTLKKKSAALADIFKDFISQRTYNFILMLIRAGKLNYLSEIILQAKKLNLNNRQLAEVIVESVIPLSPEQEEKIAALVKEKLKGDVVLKNVVNEKILGGLRLKIKDTVIEGSLFGKIARLKKKIEEIE